ncbi:L-threonylcarbamoyladenylate synthase [Chakrabartyella piscis]|uniref:L-threonylcarbamoyladenylate synthase n=1 Tax=Chakrabartyella piscis TaxID=2918914 RepID=UPI0029588033|nr:L-threonylcarbamoyladenylate synthase [Chakrabartyella piscis]
MNTRVIKINPENPEIDLVVEAAEVLKNGGLVAFPTETVYGLGGNGLDTDACKKIYEAKGRPSDNPLILHISQFSELRSIVREIPPMGEKLMEAFWPGPLTMVFPKADVVPLSVTGGLDTVAVRFPTHPVALAIIRASGLPIAGPSANSSGKPSPTRASHVEFDLSGKIDMIVDGGASHWGLESTIVDVSGEVPVILRPGAITKEMMEDIVGEVQIDPAILSKPTKDLKPKAPGMKYTHYSPKAEVTMVSGDADSVVKTINELVANHHKEGKTVGVMATEETKALYQGDYVFSLGNREDFEEIGANLYKHLRKFDFYEVDFVYAEVFAEEGEGLAIMNRLQKAAGYRRLDV